MRNLTCKTSQPFSLVLSALVAELFEPLVDKFCQFVLSSSFMLQWVVRLFVIAIIIFVTYIAVLLSQIIRDFRKL